MNRILSWLAEGALDKDRCAELSDKLSAAKKKSLVKDNSPVNLELGEVQETLYEVIKNLNRLNISTLDSYFNQRAQCFSLELELPLNWQIMEDAQDEMYRQAVLSEIFQDNETVKRYTQFIKNSDLKRSVFDQMLSSVKSLYFLWREAPAEAWDALKAPQKDMNYNGFQTLLAETLDRLHYFLGDENIEDENESEQEETGKKKTKKDIDYFKNFNVSKEELFDNFLDFFGHAIGRKCYELVKYPDDGIRISKVDITDPDTIDCLIKLTKLADAQLKYVWKKQSDFYRDTLGQFHKSYWNRKKITGQLRFADIPWLLSQDGFVKRQLNDSFRMDSSIRHLMLDEFQDTSLDQWRVLKPLASKTSSEENCSFFCVGDSKQAIYGWRGGEAQLLVSLGETFHIDPINMTKSFRSGSAIMQAVNDLFEEIHNNPLIAKKRARKNEPQPMLEAVKEWQTNRFTHHESDDKCKNLPSYVELRTAPYREPAPGEDVNSQAVKDERNNTDKLRMMTYEYAAQKVEELYPLAEARGLSIGVLVRENEDGAIIADCIKSRNHNLECSLEGDSPLLDSYEVCQILALMKWIDHPGDVYSYYKVSQSPLAEMLGIQDRWIDSRDDKQRMKVVLEDCKILNKIRSDLFRDGYGLTVQRWVEKLMPEAGARSRRRLEKLEELANKYDSQGSTRTDDFINYINTASVSDSFQARIQIMTYHKAKGLEFDIVVLPQLDTQLVTYKSIPVVYGRKDAIKPPDSIITYISGDYRYLLPLDQQELFTVSEKKQMQESLCNLYVAMTRARQGLYMILPPPKTGKMGTHKTYEDVLLGTLGNVTDKKSKEENKVYYSTGDENWIYNTPSKEQSQTALMSQRDAKCSHGEPTLPSEGEKLEVSANFAFHDSKRSYVPLPASAWTTNVKPSSFVKVVTAEVDNFTSDSSLSQSVRGTLFHCWLADIKWLEDYQVDDQRLIDLGIGIGLQQESFVDLLPAFKSLLKHPNVVSALKRPDESWEAHQEKNAAGILEDKGIRYLVSGVIDRLTVHRGADGKVDKAIILDFKTVRKGSNISDVRARYAGQMDAYRQMVSKMFGISDSVVETILLVLEGNF